MARFQRSKYAWFAFFAASLFALGASAGEPECYRSTECDGNLICVDLVCTPSDEPQTVCESQGACDWMELCDQGVCKPDGISCTAEYGRCTYDHNKTSCRCDDGSASETSSGSAGEDPTGGDGVPDTGELPGDKKLYAQCVAEAGNCDAPPDPNEVCTEAQLAECTDLMNLYFTLEDNCSGDDEDIPTGGSTGPGDPGSSGGDADIPTARAENHPEVGPSELADCCEELTEIENGDEPEEAALIDCLEVLAPDDCDGFAECGERYGKDDAAGDSQEEAGDADKTGDDRDGNDAATSDAGTDGCQFVPAPAETNLLNLIRLFI